MHYVPVLVYLQASGCRGITWPLYCVCAVQSVLEYYDAKRCNKRKNAKLKTYKRQRHTRVARHGCMCMLVKGYAYNDEKVRKRRVVIQVTVYWCASYDVSTLSV